MLAVAIDVHCLVHWTEEDKVTVVRMCSVFDGTTVGDSCSVDQKFILMQRSWLLVRSMIKGIKFSLRRGHRVYLKWNTSYKCYEHLQLQLNFEGYMHYLCHNIYFDTMMYA